MEAPIDARSCLLLLARGFFFTSQMKNIIRKGNQPGITIITAIIIGLKEFA
jgi:hypothetical protein